MAEADHFDPELPVPEAFWSERPETLLGRLHSSPSGLTSQQARERLLKHGPNALRPPSRFGRLRLLTRQFESPLVAILVFAAVVSLVVGDWTDAAIVLVILGGSALLGFGQEYRASLALERLRSRVRVRATVLRDGEPRSVPPEELVPGDVISLAAGSLVPADGVVLEGRDLFAAEAALTGEAFPVEKRPGPIPTAATLAERTNCVFMGTSVRSGTARALVVRTGEATVFGGIAARLRLRSPETEFERGIRQYGYLLMRITVFVVLFVFAAQFELERPAIDSLLFALALAVAISPELLPAIIQVTLARGARDMAAHGVIVRRLEAIENFGSMNVLCTDKTGTLTRGVLDLDAVVDPQGRASDDALRIAWLNASLQTGLASPLDEAISREVQRRGVGLESARKLDEIPYDFVRKRMSVVVADGEGALLISKGAFDRILEVCSQVRECDGLAPLDGAQRKRLEDLFAGWSEKGARVLGLATRPLRGRERYERTDEAAMTFVGFLVFLDPPKPGAAATLDALRERGVAIKVVTGDNRLVTAHLARCVGFDEPRMLTGRDLDQLHGDALRRIAEETDLFVEVDPNQKERILLALKQAGHVVGFLGDGINDASALHCADVSISVDRAADVAKEAADFVLLEPDLDVLRRGIERGRASFANTLKYIAITTSANFGNMLSMAAASVFLPFLPLLAKQILLNNLLSDVPMVGLPSDRVDAERTLRPQRWDVRTIRNFMLVFGLISSAFDLVTFAALWWLSRGAAGLFRTGWFLESLLSELVIVLVVRTRRPIYRSAPARMLWVPTAAVASFAVAVPWLPGSGWFEFMPLPPVMLLTVLAVTVAYAGASELAKRRFAIP